MRFIAGQRLRCDLDYNTVRSEGKRIDCGVFVIQLRQNTNISNNNLKIRRMGVIASRAVGNAVKRNRGKRLLREIFRLNQNILPTGCDIVLVARKKIDEYSFQELQKRYLAGLKKLGI